MAEQNLRTTHQPMILCEQVATTDTIRRKQRFRRKDSHAINHPVQLMSVKATGHEGRINSQTV